jgi:tetratricopeptide (TPR) repeat protein
MKKTAIAAVLLLLAGPASGAGYDALNAGIEYWNRESWENAIAWLDKAIAAGDLTPDQMHAAYFDRAGAYSNSGQPEKAIADYDAALALVPDDTQSLVARSFAYIVAGKTDQAVASLQDLQKKHPKSATINFYLGLMEWGAGKYDDASAAFAESLKNSNSEYTWLWLKLADLKRGKDTERYHNRYYFEVSWPTPLVEVYAGNSDEESALASVKDYGEGEGCEASFYLAELRFVKGDVSGGKPMMEKSASDCPSDNLERTMAQFELKKMQ